MKINMTKKEYLLLLDMLYLSDWMMHSHEVKGEDNAYKQFRKKLLSLYKDFGADERIEYVKSLDNYFERQAYDSEVYEKFIQPYDDETFWAQLISRLVERDIVEDIGLKAYSKLEFFERAAKIIESEPKYAEEFDKHGLDNLRIVVDES